MEKTYMILCNPWSFKIVSIIWWGQPRIACKHVHCFDSANREELITSLKLILMDKTRGQDESAEAPDSQVEQPLIHQQTEWMPGKGHTVLLHHHISLLHLLGKDSENENLLQPLMVNFF